MLPLTPMHTFIICLIRLGYFDFDSRASSTKTTPSTVRAEYDDGLFRCCDRGSTNNNWYGPLLRCVCECVLWPSGGQHVFISNFCCFVFSCDYIYMPGPLPIIMQLYIVKLAVARLKYCFLFCFLLSIYIECSSRAEQLFRFLNWSFVCKLKANNSVDQEMLAHAVTVYYSFHTTIRGSWP